MNNVLFRSNGFIICKRTDRVDCGMDNNTRKQASAAIKDRDRQEADRDGKGDLAKIADKIHTAALNRSPRKITSSGNPTQSIHRMRQTVSAGS